MAGDTTNDLAETMFQVFRLMKEEMSFMNELTHLSILQIHTLIFLHHNTKTTMSDIANHFHVELPSATSLVNKLCEQKLVERYTDDADRRLVRIALTENGKTLLKQVMRERRRKLQNVLSILSEKERSDLLILLKTLHAKLKQ